MYLYFPPCCMVSAFSSLISFTTSSHYEFRLSSSLLVETLCHYKIPSSFDLPHFLFTSISNSMWRPRPVHFIIVHAQNTITYFPVFFCLTNPPMYSFFVSSSHTSSFVTSIFFFFLASMFLLYTTLVALQLEYVTFFILKFIFLVTQHAIHFSPLSTLYSAIYVYPHTTTFLNVWSGIWIHRPFVLIHLAFLHNLLPHSRSHVLYFLLYWCSYRVLPITVVIIPIYVQTFLYKFRTGWYRIQMTFSIVLYNFRNQLLLVCNYQNYSVTHTIKCFCMSIFIYQPHIYYEL